MDTLKFLEDKLRECKKRIAQTEDYKEAQILERLVGELSHKVVPRMAGYKKNSMNSPAAIIPWGNRLHTTYRIIQELVDNNNGVMSISKLEEILKEKHGIKRIGKGSVVSKYIDLYNRKHKDSIGLNLLPLRRLDGKRVAKYTKVISTNRPMTLAL